MKAENLLQGLLPHLHGLRLIGNHLTVHVCYSHVLLMLGWRQEDNSKGRYAGCCHQRPKPDSLATCRNLPTGKTVQGLHAGSLRFLFQHSKHLDIGAQLGRQVFGIAKVFLQQSQLLLRTISLHVAGQILLYVF